MICSSGIGFDPVVQGTRLHFGFHGIWQGVAVLYDRETQSHWLHLTGECIEGRFRGEKLKPIPGRHVAWSQWKRDYPQGEIMASDPRFEGQYFPKASAERGLDFFPRGFLSTIQSRDSRMPLSALCYGVEEHETAKAYPFLALEKVADGVVNDEISGTPIVIVFDRATRSATGFYRTSEADVLEFEGTLDHRFRDRKSGSLFTLDGDCIQGPHRGRRLDRTFGLQTEWYGWFAAHPRTEVYEPRR